MNSRRQLRVCHVAYSFYETDNRVMRYAETLAARGDRVDVIALRRPGQSWRGTLNGVHVYRIQRRAVAEKRSWTYLLKILWFFLKSLVALSAVAARRRYDLVHVHNVPDFLVFAAWVPKLLGAAVILDIHDVLPELYAGKFGTREDSRLYRSLLIVERVSCRFADHVIVSNHLWHESLTRRSIAPARCTAILNYPDLALFRPMPGHREVSERFLFLYPGTLNHHQGLDVAIAAFAEACREMPGAEFHIYGDGPARPGLEAQARRLGLADRVQVADRVPLQDVPCLMASADVGVVPKRADGFGNEAFSTKILEFMACGVPVIVARTKVDAHYFTDDLVRFFAPGDPTALAEAFRAVYRSRREHTEWVARAREFAEHHSWQVRVGDYLEIVGALTDGTDDARRREGRASG